MRLDTFINESSGNDPYLVVLEVYKKSLPFIMELNKIGVGLQSKVLLSGRNDSTAMFTRDIRTDRSPKDTSPAAHYAVDEIFYQIFKVRARSNSIFCTPDYKTADSYGFSVYGIFPNGSDYKIIWSSKVDDLYGDYLDNARLAYFGEDEDELANSIYQSGMFDNTASDIIRQEFNDMYGPKDFDSEEEFIDARNEYVYSNWQEKAIALSRDDAYDRISDMNDEVFRFVKNNYQIGDIKNALKNKGEIMLSGKSYTAVRYDFLAYVLAYMEINKNKMPTPELFMNSIAGEDFKKYPQYDKDPLKLKRNIHSRILKSIDISDLKNHK